MGIWAGSLSAQNPANQDNAADLSNLPKVGFIPFGYTTAVSQDMANDITLRLAKKIQDEKLFQPFSISQWINKTYNKEENRAKNTDALIQQLKDAGFELTFLCYGMVSSINTKYMIKVTLHPVSDFIYTSHYIRYIDDFSYEKSTMNEKIDAAISEIVNEMKDRVWKENQFFFNKQLYIEKFKLHMFLITSIKNTDETLLVPVDFMKLVNTDFRVTDAFFNEMLLYSFHKTGLFKIKNDNIPNVLKAAPEVPADIDYRVSADMLLSENLNVLMLTVWNQKDNTKVISYNYPFVGLDMNTLEQIMQKNSFLINMSILSDKEREQVGLAEITLKKSPSSDPIICNNYYLGKSNQADLLLPLGENDLRIGKRLYKMFIFPYTKNYQYWDFDQSVMSQMINILGENE